MIKNNTKYLVELISSHTLRFESGPGKVKEIHNFLEGKDILLVTSEGFTKRKITKKILKSCEALNVNILDTVEPNPTIDSIDKITEELKGYKFSSIVALGGGSVIDTAKALSIVLSQKTDLSMNGIFRENKGIKIDYAIPITAIPTTSGTGSEVTQFATIWDNKHKKKYSLESKHIKPKAIILDPELTVHLSNEMTLFPALDSISHSLESIWNKNSDSTSLNFATESLRLSAAALPEIIKKPHSIENRFLMQLASLLAGLAINKTKTAIAHSISYPLTSYFGIPHGLAASFSLISIYELINKKTDFKFPETLTVEKIIKILNELKLGDRILKLATREQIKEVRNQMFSPERAKNFIYPISDSDLKDIIDTSL